MSDTKLAELVDRIRKLGIKCEQPPSTDHLDQSIAALACFPMHMVACASVLVAPRDGEESTSKDMFHISGVREAFVIGEQEGSLAISDEDTKTLNDFLAFHRPADRIIYDYALETLSMYFSIASADVVEVLRMAIARSIVAVSKAAGEGWFGGGSKPSDEQRVCIETVCRELNLGESKTASAVLEEINAPALSGNANA